MNNQILLAGSRTNLCVKPRKISISIGCLLVCSIRNKPRTFCTSSAKMAKLTTSLPELKLNDGNSMTMLGYGTGTAWYKSGDESKIDKALVDSIKTAIGMGYTHLDGAEVYKTETELGMAIQESGVARDKLFVTTKINNNLKDVKGSFETSLKKLKLDYVDLYLIHQPFFAESDQDLQKAWADMEEIKASGKAKSIGVSNFLPKHLEAIKKTQKVPPAMNQIEFHPYLQHPELLEYHKKNNIATAAYGPLSPVAKAAPGPVDDVLASLAKKYAVNEGEILLRWCVDQDIVPVTTSSKEQRMSDMLRISAFKLTPSEIKQIIDLGDKKHYRGFWTAKFDSNDRS